MSRFHLIAPSGYCINQQAALRGLARLTEAGHQVDNSAVIARRCQRFAGTEAERLADVNSLVNLKTPNTIVMAVRGGYGASRLLEDIDWQGLAARQQQDPLLLCGHSDFTAIQCGLLAQGNVISFSGPMLAANFGAEEMNTFTEHHFWQALRNAQFTLEWQGDGPQCATEGTLWGGNLAMIISLYHAGILAQQNAIILGSFSGSAPNDYDAGYNLDSVCDFLRTRLSVPLIGGLDFGHEQRTVTLPLGARAVLKNDKNSTQLTLSGHPVLKS
ncbi:MAG: LD-carboxypeptidase [Citrobacter freundii]|nr:LD-carboxypeptidase [Citrobacter freundii]